MLVSQSFYIFGERKAIQTRDIRIRLPYVLYLRKKKVIISARFGVVVRKSNDCMIRWVEKAYYALLLLYWQGSCML